MMLDNKRMQQLVQSDPITPYLHKVRPLAGCGISSILVVGGCGDYFEKADLVICMNNYSPSDETARAHAICAVDPQKWPVPAPFGEVAFRALVPHCLATQGKVVARRLQCIQFDQIDLDLSGVEQFIEVSQVRAVANMLIYLEHSGLCDGLMPLATVLDRMERVVQEKGLDGIATFRKPGDLSLPRRGDVAAAINRLRVLKMVQVGTTYVANRLPTS